MLGGDRVNPNGTTPGNSLSPNRHIVTQGSPLVYKTFPII
jgi:hypothetical protein